MILQRLFSGRELKFQDPPETHLTNEYIYRPKLDKDEILMKNSYHGKHKNPQERFKRKLTERGHDISGLSFDFEKYPGKVLIER